MQQPYLQNGVKLPDLGEFIGAYALFADCKNKKEQAPYFRPYYGVHSMIFDQSDPA